MKFRDSCPAKVCVAWFSSCARVPPVCSILGLHRRVFSHVSGSKIQIRFQGTGSRPGEVPGSPRRSAFEQLREIELRVAATLTPPEVGVCQFPARTHISWTLACAYRKLVSPHLPLTIVVAAKICLLRIFVGALIPLSREFTILFAYIFITLFSFILSYIYIHFDLSSDDDHIIRIKIRAN